jgi:hypothetical protein
MKGLNRLLKNNLEEGLIIGIKISRLTKILHLLFVDDVLILSKASLTEWRVIVSNSNLFFQASKLSVNSNKSTVHFEGLSVADLNLYKNLMP